MALAEADGEKVPSWRQQVPGKLLKTLRLTATEHDVWLALCDLQRGAHVEVFGGAIALTKAIDPDAEWKDYRTTNGRGYTHSRRLPQVKRSIWSLRRKGLIRLLAVGGGKEPGGKGRASTYGLGLAVEAYWERQRRPLRVLPNSVANDTVSGPRTVSSTTLLNSVTHDTPASSSSGLSAPPQTPDDERRKGSRTAHGDPDAGSEIGQLTPLGAILHKALPRASDPPGAIADLLATEPAERAPELDLRPRKPRR